jgi:hypothetical protein
VLHVAGSLFHDIRQARALGSARLGSTAAASVPEDVDPATVFPTSLRSRMPSSVP